MTKQLSGERCLTKARPLSHARRVGEERGVDAERLRGADRTWRISRARAVVAHVLIDGWDIREQELGKNASAVARAISSRLWLQPGRK